MNIWFYWFFLPQSSPYDINYLLCKSQLDMSILLYEFLLLYIWLPNIWLLLMLDIFSNRMLWLIFAIEVDLVQWVRPRAVTNER